MDYQIYLRLDYTSCTHVCFSVVFIMAINNSSSFHVKRTPPENRELALNYCGETETILKNKPITYYMLRRNSSIRDGKFGGVLLKRRALLMHENFEIPVKFDIECLLVKNSVICIISRN